MKNRLIRIVLITLLISPVIGIQAQNNPLIVKGTITDTEGEPLIGAAVSIKNQPGFGVVTDIDGNYSIKTGENEVLLISYVGYHPYEEPVRGRKEIDIVLTHKTTDLEDVTVVGAGTQRKVSIAGAITTVDVQTLKVPTSNLSNALAGNVAGVIAVQRSGEPGHNSSDFWIRGISTFGASSGALILVDGIERNLNEVNVEDVESFSVLKDASATAIYGQRGANGVVLITTKRGQAGKVKISFKGEYGLNTPSRKTSYVDALQYAALSNEARLSRNKLPIYDDADMVIIRDHLDPDLYPNVDWYSTLFNNVMSNYRAMINISGGGTTARYFISGAYYNEDGMYKESNLNSYGTNVKYERYNFRSNVDVNITKSTILEFGVNGWITDQIYPGTVAGDIWGAVATLPSIAVPVKYSNGYYPTYGETGHNVNPYVLVNETGYLTRWTNKIETNLALRQNLDFVTPGLNLYGRFSFDSFSYNDVNRNKWPDLYRAESQRNGKGQLVFRKITNSASLSQRTSSWGDRRNYGELNLTYERVFKEKHRIGGLVLYYQQSYSRNDTGGDIRAAVPKRNMALSGRVTYGFDDRYFTEFNFGYTGSENFEKHKRFGFFPAIAGAWLISNEKFIREHIPWLNLFKIRYSYGEVGNDILGTRFPYISSMSFGGSYSFGDRGQNNLEGVYIDVVGTENLTWEVAKKHNIGIDFGFLDYFNLTVDIFRDNREKIFMQRGNMPPSAGLSFWQKPWSNIGKMKSQGIDGTASFAHKIGNLNFMLRGNLTYAYSEIIDRDEADNALYYQMEKGYRFGQTRGLIALGLFESQEDIDNSPVHTFSNVMPGDIKYKDVNGDGVINDYDIVPLGSSTIPGVIYGMGFSCDWKGIDFNMLLQGAGNSDFFVSGMGVYPFDGGETGNILTYVADPANRWISREISETPDTERQDVIFPRLTYGHNPNNNRASTWWLRNSRFLRLKHLEVGYTLPRQFTRKYLMENVRLYFIGNNLMVWDKFKWWDPELANGNGAVYPLQKNFTFGLTVNF